MGGEGEISPLFHRELIFPIRFKIPFPNPNFTPSFPSGSLAIITFRALYWPVI